MTHSFRVGAGLACVLGTAMVLGGCTGGPTYGTDKTATEQLLSDIGGIAAVGSKQERPTVQYRPRPGLVVPPEAREKSLAAPQASLADRQTNPQWVETPEETRQRLRKEADENADNPNYRSPLLTGRGQAGTLTESQQWEAFRKAKAENNAATALTQRRYLSDPPPVYRQVSDPAALDDLGEKEADKEKRRLKEAEKEKKKGGWWNPFR